MAASGIVLTSTEQWVISAGVWLFFVLLAFASRLLLSRLALLSRRTRTKLDDLLTQSLMTPVSIIFIVVGFWLALIRLPALKGDIGSINQGFRIVFIILGGYMLGRAGGALITWYGDEVAPRTTTDVDDKLLPVLRRVGGAAIGAIALMLILDQLHVNVSPLIAGLGIGTVMAGLALQPTLSNYMAGTYVISDAVVRKGCYIILDTGQEGTVDSIGWRSTKLRQWEGNTIVLPNSKLAEAIVTVSKAGDESKVFRVECGVSYDSDLERVEGVVREVAAEVLQRCPEGSHEFKPLVRFKEFGASNIIFSVVLEAADRMSVFQLKHEFIKALHQRFLQEHIVIEYPVSKLYFADGTRRPPPAD